MTKTPADALSDGSAKVDWHQQHQQHPHDSKHASGDKGSVVHERPDRHPVDGLPINAGPRKGGGGGGWGALGEEVGGFKDIHHVADLDAEEAAALAEAAKDVAEEAHKGK